MLDSKARKYTEPIARIIARFFIKLHLSPDFFTALGAIAAVVTMYLIAQGQFRWAVLGVILSGVPDLIDGAIARESETTSLKGALIDSVTDRLTDALIFSGAIYYFSSNKDWKLVVAIAALIISLMISYVRARAEGLGLKASGGLMERAERLIVFGIGLFFLKLEWALLIISLAGIYTILLRSFKGTRAANEAEGVITKKMVRQEQRNNRIVAYQEALEKISKHQLLTRHIKFSLWSATFGNDEKFEERINKIVKKYEKD